MKYLANVGLDGTQLANLEPLLRVLQAQGQALVAPDDRSQLHPLAIPLTCAPAPISDTPNVAVSPKPSPVSGQVAVGRTYSCAWLFQERWGSDAVLHPVCDVSGVVNASRRNTFRK
jgi:hypothetical protein